jgi:hypothetical protein
MSDTDLDDNVTIQLDHDAVERDILAGAEAFKDLLRNASLDWNHWSATILGLRGLRALAFERARTSSMKSQAYRDAMTGLLVQRKYSIYDQIDKQTRSDAYRMMDRLEDIDAWYAGLERAEKLRWKHPSTIVKHCPKEYLTGGMNRHNKRPKAKKKKGNPEAESLREMLIQVIKRLAKYEPDALELLDRLYQTDPDDGLDGLDGDDEDE